MYSEGTETQAENVFVVHIQGEGHFPLFFEDLRPIFPPSRSLILDIKLCFTDEGLNSNAAFFGTWQTLLPNTNGKLNEMLVKL